MKYDLSNGQTIGKKGKPVQDLRGQLSRFTINELIDSFEDENYRRYLNYMHKNFVEYRITNIGTFLMRLNRHKHYEQYFAAGIYNVATDLRTPMKDVPKQLIKFIKEHAEGDERILLTDEIIHEYKRNPDLFMNIFNLELRNITVYARMDLMVYSYYSYRFQELITTYNYNYVALLNYVDNLIEYEGLDFRIIHEIYDYARTASGLSPKFEKYPKYFLTSHKIVIRNYERLRVTYNEEIFKNRINTKLEWSKSGYSVIYPKSTQDIKDEAAQQQHCVASYINRVINGECHIMFLRKRDTPTESLITLELKENKIHQARGKHNRDPTIEEQTILTEYEKYLFSGKYNQQQQLTEVI